MIDYLNHLSLLSKNYDRNDSTFVELRKNLQNDILNQIQRDNIMKYLSEECKSQVVDYMIVNRIRNLNTYINLCDQMTWPLGSTNTVPPQFTEQQMKNSKLIFQLQQMINRVDTKQIRKNNKIEQKQFQMQLLQEWKNQEEQKQKIKLQQQNRNQLLETRSLKNQIYIQKLYDKLDLAKKIKIEHFINNKKKQSERVDVTGSSKQLPTLSPDLYLTCLKEFIQYIISLKDQYQKF
ncbi:hypothetical protein pb186bvf_010212 [Paramecium bursaria]